MLEYTYTDDMVLYYSGYLGSQMPGIEEDSDGTTYVTDVDVLSVGMSQLKRVRNNEGNII